MNYWTCAVSNEFVLITLIYCVLMNSACGAELLVSNVIGSFASINVSKCVLSLCVFIILLIVIINSDKTWTVADEELILWRQKWLMLFVWKLYTVSKNWIYRVIQNKIPQYENHDISEIHEHFYSRFCLYVEDITMFKCAASCCVYFTCTVATGIQPSRVNFKTQQKVGFIKVIQATSTTFVVTSL